MPAEKMRTAAIWAPVRAALLSFISLKELPQIMHSRIKMDQLMNLLLMERPLIAGAKGHKTREYNLIFFNGSYVYCGGSVQDWSGRLSGLTFLETRRHQTH